MDEPTSRSRTADRDYDIWQRYTNGETQAEIAEVYELSQQTVSRIVTRMREDTPIEERRARQRRQLADLDHVRRSALDLVDADPIPAYSNGKPILMPDGRTAEDHTGRVRAMDMVIKTMEREARALGLDTPVKQKVEVDGSLRYEIVGVGPEDLT
jgi:transposase